MLAIGTFDVRLTILKGRLYSRPGVSLGSMTPLLTFPYSHGALPASSSSERRRVSCAMYEIDARA